MSYVLVRDEQYVELYKNEELVLYCDKHRTMEDLAEDLADLLSENGIKFVAADSDEYHLED